jgi:hypothetical protein
VPFILNKPICGRGWILFLGEAEYLPFVDAGDFCATGLLAKQPEEDFRIELSKWLERPLKPSKNQIKSNERPKVKPRTLELVVSELEQNQVGVRLRGQP